MSRQAPLSCSGHTRPVVDLDFSDVTPDGSFLISACKDGKPMLRQGETGDWVGTFEGHKGAVWGATLNREATRAATGAADFSAMVWDAVTGDVLHTFSHKHIVKAVDFSRDSALLLTGCQDKIVRVFRLESPDAEPDILQGHTLPLKTVLISHDQSLVFSGSDDKEIRVWDLRQLRQVQSLTTGAAVSDIQFSKDGTLLVAVHGNEVSFWDTSSFTKIKSTTFATKLYSASLHPDKTCFVAGGEDLKMYKYDYELLSEKESYKGHFGPVHCVRFSPDGELYASGSEDGTLRLWQNTVGKAYGLWKAAETEDTSGDTLL
ncbi:serine-threonine kinase receptor-associated protein-like [Corticium candelabrum]|uniref:serine-threonine kinase receptor-associated protein-like n=1 Tax=Corticium candelabrum TaxID=121492 RepID=UPI002E2570F4|nr:serine-threonine kinase receptor-associated protein-like [Corticium candelabrum]